MVPTLDLALAVLGGLLGSLRGLPTSLLRRPTPGAFVLFSAAQVSIYTGLGLLAGRLGEALLTAAWPRVEAWLPLAAGLFGLLFGLSLLGLLPDPAAVLRRAAWDQLVTEGVRGLDRLFGPFSPVPRPVKVSLRAFLLGGFQGFLPCALVYAFLARAAAAGTTEAGGVLMLAFGVGTVLTSAIWFFSALPHRPTSLVERPAGLLVVVSAAQLVKRGLGL